jgi:hypothetical protein
MTKGYEEFCKDFASEVYGRFLDGLSTPEFERALFEDGVKRGFLLARSLLSEEASKKGGLSYSEIITFMDKEN